MINMYVKSKIVLCNTLRGFQYLIHHFRNNRVTTPAESRQPANNISTVGVSELIWLVHAAPFTSRILPDFVTVLLNSFLEHCGILFIGLQKSV